MQVGKNDNSSCDCLWDTHTHTYMHAYIHTCKHKHTNVCRALLLGKSDTCFYDYVWA